MLYFLISFASLIFLSNSAWTSEIKLLLSKFCEARGKIAASFLHVQMINPTKKICPKVEKNVEMEMRSSLLDLPDLALECILERLPPQGLSTMAAVCKSMRDISRSDHLWKKHMDTKWGRLIKDAAMHEWQRHLASSRRTNILDQDKRQGLLFRTLVSIWPFSLLWPKVEKGNKGPRTGLPEDSIMALYVSLEKGKFWFPAQVYNRENGHSGFVLSCYDAKVRYDSRSDAFVARFSCHGRPSTEEIIQWNRLRAPPVNTPPDDLHISDCLNDLKPGDHIEIQWRKNKDFPYGWWYGVIGHLDSCNRNENHCSCHTSDTVVLEFNQYSPGSQWRVATINRKEHQEVANEADGFYGGVRKLYNEEEISTWKCLWPTKVLE